MSFLDWHRQFVQRAASPVDLTSRCLERIAARDDQLQAWVLVDDPGARQQAELSQARYAKGQPLGPLDGIPVAIKDIVDVAGWPTRAGSKLRESYQPDADAPIVQRLKQCGAVILGKTVTTQFACFDPPPTCHPLDPESTPGGSSSGSAAAVADGMTLMALGSQTGGSITRPASYCGVAGLKPTFGRVSLQGVVPVSSHLDHLGWLCPTAADLALTWQALMTDRAVADSSLEGDSPVADLPVVVDLAVDPELDSKMDAQVRRAHLQTVDQLRLAGADIRSAALPCPFEQIIARHKTIMAREAWRYHQTDFERTPEWYGEKISGLLRSGAAVTEDQYQRALQFQQQFITETAVLFERADVLIMPSTSTPVPATRETTGDPSFNAPWSLSGHPTVTVCAGRDDRGMPCGLQLIGRWGEDEALLHWSQWCESCGL